MIGAPLVQMPENVSLLLTSVPVASAVMETPFGVYPSSATFTVPSAAISPMAFLALPLGARD